MLRILDRHADGSLHPSSSAELVALPPEGTTRWIDISDPSHAELEALRQAFAFHPIAIADCAAYGRASRADDYGDYLFVVSHAFTQDPSDPLLIHIHELHAFVGESYLVTVHETEIAAHERMWREASQRQDLLARGPSWPWLQSVHAMVDECEPLVEKLAEELDVIERIAIEEGGQVELATAFRIKRIAIAMRRTLRPLRDSLRMVLEIAQDPDPRIPNRAVHYLESLTDRVVRLTEAVEDAREVTNGIVNGFHATQATRTNALITRLTVFSAVFLPLSVIVGFWGQNFDAMPFRSDIWFALMLASMVITPLFVLWWIRTRWMDR